MDNHNMRESANLGYQHIWASFANLQSIVLLPSGIYDPKIGVSFKYLIDLQLLLVVDW